VEGYGSDEVAALQFDLHFDESRFALVEVQTGAAAAAAGKQALYSDVLGSGARVMVTGLNQAVMPDGEVARVVLAPLDGPDGAATLEMGGPVVSDPFGNPIEAELGEPLAYGSDPQAPASKSDEDSGSETGQERQGADVADAGSSADGGVDLPSDSAMPLDQGLPGLPAADAPSAASADSLTAAIIERLTGYRDKPARPYWPSPSASAQAAAPRAASGTRTLKRPTAGRTSVSDAGVHQDAGDVRGDGPADERMLLAAAVVAHPAAHVTGVPAGRSPVPGRPSPRSPRAWWPVAAGMAGLAVLVAARRRVLAGPNRTR